MQQISKGAASTGSGTRQYVRMRRQPLWLYRSACLLLALSGVMMIFERVNARAYYDTLKLMLGPDLIKWVPIKDAAAKARADKKPILLVNMVRNDYYSNRAESSVLRDRHNADIINQHYVPVLVDGDISNAASMSPIMDQAPFTSEYNRGFGMVAVPYKLIGSNYSDVMSTDNTDDLSRLDAESNNERYNNYYDYGSGANLAPVSRNLQGYNWGGREKRIARYFPALYWFETNGDVTNFLDRAYKWHIGKPYRGTIRWQPETAQIDPARPRLLTFAMDCGSESDQLRNLLFRDENATFVNKKFEPVLYDVKRENEELKIAHIAERTKGDHIDLRKAYKIKQLPAMVIVWPSGQSRVVYCERGVYNIKEDLTQALQEGPLWETSEDPDTVKCSHDRLCRIKGHNH